MAHATRDDQGASLPLGQSIGATGSREQSTDQALVLHPHPSLHVLESDALRRHGEKPLQGAAPLCVPRRGVRGRERLFELGDLDQVSRELPSGLARWLPSGFLMGNASHRRPTGEMGGGGSALVEEANPSCRQSA